MRESLNKSQIERFSRQLVLKNIGARGQKKILSSKILIVGIGGLGCPAAENLVRAGIGTIGLVDNDTINLSNIHRQSLFTSKDIKPDDIVIVMWTYLSRLSLQWPARTSVPFNNITGPASGWKSMISGFNNFFGLEPSKESDKNSDEYIQQYIEDSTKTTYLNPMGIYNRYYNNLILQKMADGFLKSTGARVIHLSVEAEPSLRQLEEARQLLDESLKEPYNIPDPADWYDIDVDHTSCLVILDPSIPPAENDEHPSVTHHSNFAEHIYNQYFKESK